MQNDAFATAMGPQGLSPLKRASCSSTGAYPSRLGRMADAVFRHFHDANPSCGSIDTELDVVAPFALVNAALLPSIPFAFTGILMPVLSVSVCKPVVMRTT